MEFKVQLPSCHHMKDKDRHQRLHFDTTYTNIQVHHWIKIVMRFSNPDTDDPSKRRHFEISIDSPIHIISCRATQSNTSVPAYTSPGSGINGIYLYDCGCPGAARRCNTPALYSALDAITAANTPERNNTPEGPTLPRPLTAHLNGPPVTTRPRPMHMLRAPSFDPPAFEDEPPPPALITPPPHYDEIASPTNGLADYFARLSDTYDGDNSGDESHGDGRVNIPLTPGARTNMSMDIGRSWVPVGRRS